MLIGVGLAARWRDRGEPARRAAHARSRRWSARASPWCCTCRGPSTSSCPGSTLASFTGGSNGAGTVRPGRAAPVRDRPARAARRSGGASSSAAALPAAHRPGRAPHLGRARAGPWPSRRSGSRGLAQRGTLDVALPAGRRAPRAGRRRPGPGDRHGRGRLRGRPPRLPVRLATDRVRAGRGGGGRRASSRCSAPPSTGAGRCRRATTPAPSRSSTTRTTTRPFRVLWIGDPDALPARRVAARRGPRLRHHRRRHAHAREPVGGLRRGPHRPHRRRPRPGPHRPDRPPRPAARADGHPLRRGARAAGAGAVLRRADPGAGVAAPRRSPASSTSNRSTCRPGSPSTATRRPSPMRAELPSSVEVPTERRGRRRRSPLDLSGATAVLPDEDGHLRWSGPVEGDSTAPAVGVELRSLGARGRRRGGRPDQALRLGHRVRGRRRRRRHPALPHPAACATACSRSRRSPGSGCCGCSCAAASKRPIPTARAIGAGAAAPPDPRDGRRAVRSSRLTALVILGRRRRRRPRARRRRHARRPRRPPDAVVAGVAMPAATPPGTLSSTWYCAGGTATDDGFADHVVLIANPTDDAAPRPSSPCSPAASPRRRWSPTRPRTSSTTTTAPPATTTTEPPPEPPAAARVVEVPAHSRIEVVAARAREGAAGVGDRRGRRRRDRRRAPDHHAGGGRRPRHRPVQLHRGAVVVVPVGRHRARARASCSCS